MPFKARIWPSRTISMACLNASSAYLTGIPLASQNSRRGPHSRTGIWLGVKPSIEGVVIFAVAVRAHQKCFIEVCRTVVRQRLNDCESRSAIGAVRERITVSSIPGANNSQRQSGQIAMSGRSDSLSAALLAVANLELAHNQRDPERKTPDSG